MGSTHMSQCTCTYVGSWGQTEVVRIVQSPELSHQPLSYYCLPKISMLSFQMYQTCMHSSHGGHLVTNLMHFHLLTHLLVLYLANEVYFKEDGKGNACFKSKVKER